MNLRIFILCILVLQACVSQPEKQITVNIDSLVNQAIKNSEQALYAARFSEAREMVQLSHFNSLQQFQDIHALLLTIQDQRVERFMNIVLQSYSDPEENFNRLEKLSSSIHEWKKKEFQARFYLALSSAYRALDNLNSSDIYESKAFQLYKELEKFDKLAEIRASKISRTHMRYLNKGKKNEILKLIPKYEEEISYSKKYSKYVLSFNTRHLAQIHRRQTGDYNKALQLFYESLELREEIGFRPFLPASYSSLGDVYMKQLEFQLAIEMYMKAIELADEIGFVRYQCTPYLSIGEIHFAQGKKEEAAAFYTKALESATTHNYEPGIEAAKRKLRELKD